MLIGIDGSRAFLKNRTGIEEYSYQVIKNLRKELESFEVFLYVRKKQEVDFELPKNWKMKTIGWPIFWTQAGLSLEMLFHPVKTLFVPAHTVPIIHPENTVVTIHGLEYEFCGQAYSAWEKLYMKTSIRKSCKWASRIISVSQNTKQDLMKLYKVPEEKIQVIYEGCSFCHSGLDPESRIRTQILKQVQDDSRPYLLFLGRIEERKNIGNIVETFEILKEKYSIKHKLVLAGKPGFGYEHLKSRIQNMKSKNDIIELGFVSEQEKWELLKNAEVFVFPTQYEGFGIPILEAQSVGCPVVASNNSSIPEVVSCHSERSEESPSITESFNIAGSFAVAQDDTCSALLVNPQNPTEIAEAVWKILSDEKIKKDLIEKGLENVKRFSWEKCAEEIAEILIS
jgi:glycosyltransferase involved in cell wall biosynthesis